ncbi:serine/threonine-protein kinase [Pedobacter foliorum]|uniref:serine/threonine protein kinase n=1 Tax=Pedobacter foliorum TaxID=2739058 RepID=UPI0015659A78|nr:serine/threonine-protein kinase [Pedobacter foliorum]NRF39744.1 serine/threonine protein kinase [Pedobacter foliorum]
MAKVFTITEGLENMGALRTGGQGSVYKGKRMGAILSAVKLLPTPIHAENAEDKNFRDFQNEVEKLKKVNEDPSPNVVKILNSGLTESGSLPFIEMEYIEGPDLEDLLKPPHSPIFTIRETIKLADHLANALAHCHKVGVKHGDIKSNNIKFNTETGNYILLDFGLAVMSDEQRRSSLRHAGAVEFMAPEQHDGIMLFQSDIYSYGIILYELLAGAVPFPLINRVETSRNMVMLSHIEKQVPDLMELRRNRLPVEWSEEKKANEMMVPAWLLQVIEKCLQKDPEKRFHDGVSLYEAVNNNNQNVLNNEQVTSVINELKTENERLTNLVEQYQKASKAKAYMITGIIIFVCLTTFGINLVLNKRSTNAVTDSTNIVNKPTQPIKNHSKTAPKNTVSPVIPKENKDSLRTVPVSKKDSIKPKTTKDGLSNDVPEF